MKVTELHDLLDVQASDAEVVVGTFDAFTPAAMDVLPTGEVLIRSAADQPEGEPDQEQPTEPLPEPTAEPAGDQDGTSTTEYVEPF